mgnify:CR=1 FL=1
MGGSLVLEGLTEGLTLPYRLPAQHTSDASFVVIDASPGVARLAQTCVIKNVWALCRTFHNQLHCS